MFGLRISNDVITVHFSLHLLFCSSPKVSFVLWWPQPLSQINILQERTDLLFQLLKLKPQAYLRLGHSGLFVCVFV